MSVKKKYDPSGPDVNPWRLDNAAANKTILESPAFIRACRNAETEPTKRQASKFRKKRGLAYAVR